jgi:hypothetical protein
MQLYEGKLGIMQILIYEHASGGGYLGERLPLDILSEGYGMLRSLVSDLKAAAHKTTVLLDSRVGMLNPPLEADKTILVSSSAGLDKKLKKLIKKVDATYVIAPESNQTLRRLVELVEAFGGTSLNSHVNAIEKASNKMATYETLRREKLRVPETAMINLKDSVRDVKRQVRKLGFPLVFKPLDGVGCCGLSVVENESHLAKAVKKIERLSECRDFVVQRLINGVAVSVSLLSTGDEALPITLNQQLVALASPSENSEYMGGLVPFSHRLEKEALRAAQAAVESIKGLKGYVGVDLVLTEKEAFIMEVNPRLTTSYIGLRKVVNFNPAKAILGAVLNGKLPENVATKGYVFFSKVKIPLMPQIFKETYKFENVVSPPFPTASDEQACTLIAAYGDSKEEAQASFCKTKSHLLKLLRGEN